MVVFIILILISFLMFVNLTKQHKLVRNLYYIFCIWWIVLLVISKISPYGGYAINVNTYILILLFLTCFSVFFVFAKNARQEVSYSKETINNQYHNLIEKNRIIIVGIVICTICLIYYAYKYSTIITIDTFLNARDERFYVGGLFESTFELLFYNYFVSMWRYFFSFVIAYSIVFDKIKNKFFIIAVFNLFLYTYIGSSRFPIVLLVVNLVIMYIIKRTYTESKISFGSIKKLILLVIMLFVCIFVMTYITAYRRGMLSYDWNNIVENFKILYDQIIGYNIGPLSGLSYLLENNVMYNHWFFGRAVMLNGVEEIATHFSSFLGINFSSAKYVLADISNRNIILGTESFNALYTCIYWFFSDLGYFGVVMYSALFGWIEKKSLVRFIRTPSIFSLILIIHMMYFMIASNMIWQINNVDSLLYLLMIYLLAKRANKKGEI